MYIVCIFLGKILDSVYNPSSPQHISHDGCIAQHQYVILLCLLLVIAGAEGGLLYAIMDSFSDIIEQQWGWIVAVGLILFMWLGVSPCIGQNCMGLDAFFIKTSVDIIVAREYDGMYM